jgi:hypothetical protein
MRARAEAEVVAFRASLPSRPPIEHARRWATEHALVFVAPAAQEAILQSAADVPAGAATNAPAQL